jgi:hypothetical protein
METPEALHRTDGLPGRASLLRVGTAGGLVACYAVACAWSLWSRVHAVEFLATASLASAGFLIARAMGRLAAGVLADVLAGGVAVLLPGVGEVADAIAALVAVSVMSRKFVRFMGTLPYGVACCGLYLGLWFAGRWTAAVTGSHPALLVGAAVLVALVGILFLSLVVRAAMWAGASWTDAVLNTVGYPWVLLMFVVTYFIPEQRRLPG